jgi:hypothetical protein
MARQTPDIVFEPFRQPGEAGQRCQHPDCDEDGAYRAPMSREHLSDYYWFCLDHVRTYNAAWNYFAGMSEEQIERHRRHDIVWERPTWPLGAKKAHQHRVEERFRRDFSDVFENGGETERCRRLPNELELALSIMDLQPDTSFDEIRTRYKNLAKRLHPDANGGDAEAEERLKAVNHAYTILKSWYGRSQNTA